jgi:hypothetical protein
VFVARCPCAAVVPAGHSSNATALYVSGAGRGTYMPVCATCVRVCLCRYVIQGLPIVLLLAIMSVMVMTRALQLLQSKVFHVIPFGSMSNMSLLDVCAGIFISGVFMLYFGGCRFNRLRVHGIAQRVRALHIAVSRKFHLRVSRTGSVHSLTAKGPSYGCPESMCPFSPLL